ncbi:L-histidine N(alpha)-methyltransferase [Novispirillum sp. DQ9]|uniref:L-histidine N(alpha)-methyltransferase n=1 Tax=Novispirillum sp. DQ9 TaxID=3398612 RepID=UPI003C7AD62E
MKHQGLPKVLEGRPALIAADPDFRRAVSVGLRATPKSIPCRFFYDAAGSRLFDRICDLPEYYPTRTELRLLSDNAPEFAHLMGPGAEVVEFGAGSGVKVRLLLDALERPAIYRPIDISGEHLLTSAQALARDYADLSVRPVIADFTQPIPLPAPRPGVRRVGFFPGSTIGNLPPAEAVRFLRGAARLLRGGGLLIGVDLLKDPEVLRRAYDDSQGVTAAFNRNILVRANRELDADFDPERFAHRALFNGEHRRIEMHLVSQGAQTVRVAGEVFAFADGEGIHTENSYKYTLKGFRHLAASAGFTPVRAWTDPDRLFSLHWMEA